jgi:RNA polymerase sigma-70 factor, ECF subfamily
MQANGSPAMAQYRSRPGGGHEPWGLHVFEVEDGRIAHISSFLEFDSGLFARLGLPTSLD